MHWAVFLVIVVRLLCYLFTLKKPLPGILLSFLLDFLDGGVFYFIGSSVAYYELIDKPLDFTQYLLLIPVASKTPIYRLFLGLLTWRFIGMLLFYVTGNRVSFIVFPNFVEYSLLFYFVSDWAQKSAVNSKLITWIRGIRWQDYRVWGFLLFLKLIQEIGLHGPTADSRTFWMWEQISKVISR